MIWTAPKVPAPASTSYRAGRCNYDYVCIVQANGTFTVGPYEWTVDKTGAGLYVVRHNLGHTRYVALPVAVAGSDYKTSATLQAMDANSITVGTFSSTQLTDAAFGLLVLVAQ